MTGLELLAKPRQELIDALKLQIRAHNLAARACATNSSTKRVKLTPDSSTLSIELINSGITLLKSMLLTNHRQVKSISRRLIALTEMSPLSSNSRKTHKLRSILGQNAGSENSSSTSILIDPLSVGDSIQGDGIQGRASGLRSRPGQSARGRDGGSLQQLQIDRDQGRRARPAGENSLQINKI
jgi:hypothetical protein